MGQGQSLGFHLLILLLNFSRESEYLICSSNRLQIIGPEYLIEFDPINVFLTSGMKKSDFKRKFYEMLCRVNKSLKNGL